MGFGDKFATTTYNVTHEGTSSSPLSTPTKLESCEQTARFTALCVQEKHRKCVQTGGHNLHTKWSYENFMFQTRQQFHFVLMAPSCATSNRHKMWLGQRPRQYFFRLDTIDLALLLGNGIFFFHVRRRATIFTRRVRERARAHQSLLHQ